MRSTKEKFIDSLKTNIDVAKRIIADKRTDIEASRTKLRMLKSGKYDLCPRCHGEGVIGEDSGWQCDDCGGMGLVKVVIIDTEEKLIKHFGNPLKRPSNTEQGKRLWLTAKLLENQANFLKKVSKMPPKKAQEAIDKSCDPSGLRQFSLIPIFDPRKLFPVQAMPDGALPYYGKQLKKRRRKKNA